MLFDLRGRGRRRTVQAIYLTLAVLMGGGLVLFGIGGSVSGGLFDAVGLTGGGGSSSSANEQLQKQEKAALLPTIDPVTMLLEMVPLLVLYELSILLAKLFVRPVGEVTDPIAPAEGS